MVTLLTLLQYGMNVCDEHYIVLNVQKNTFSQNLKESKENECSASVASEWKVFYFYFLKRLWSIIYAMWMLIYP